MIFSLIDIGSNTVKLAVYDTPSLRPVYFISKQIGLADYVMIQDDHTCIMTEEGMLSLKSTLSSFMTSLSNQGYPPPKAFCTEACRNLENESALLSMVESVLGDKPRILTPALEAFYTVHGIIAHAPTVDGLMIDMGGASTELYAFLNKKPIGTPISIPCGCRKLYHIYQQTSSREQVVDAFFHSCDIPASFFSFNVPVYLSGGTAKAIKKFMDSGHCPPALLTNVSVLISYMIQALCEKENPMHAIFVSLWKDRYPLMLSSLFVFSSLIETFRPKQVFLSDSGTREGYLFIHFMDQ